MSSEKYVYRFDHRPIVDILLENLHDSSIPPVQVPALIDTGAAQTVVPNFLCRVLGHAFEEGTSSSTASGIGQGSIRTFVHATRLTVLQPSKDSGMSDPRLPAFEPIDFQCEFIDQFIPFVLLGQKDFLQIFRFSQEGLNGWFSLERAKKST